MVSRLTAKIDEMMGLMLEDVVVWIWQLRRAGWSGRTGESEFMVRAVWNRVTESIHKDSDMSRATEGWMT
jgi:hypothetical protein